MIYFSYLMTCKRLKEDHGALIQFHHKPISFAEEARYNKLLDEIIFEIKDKTGASNISLARLHNNGYWNNGRSMKKFTIVAEKYINGLSIMRDNKDVLCSRYSEAMDFMFYHSFYDCVNIETCTDANLKRDMTKCGFKSTYMYLIKQADGDRSEEAFIFLNFERNVLLSEEQIQYVKDLRFKILGLLNMIKK
jgi:hypothetical protein